MDPNSEKYFPEWIWQWNAGHLFNNPKEPKYCKKIENQIYNYKMAAKKTISISRHKISDQKWENHFPEGIFPCKYNYTAEIKFEKSYSAALLWGKQILNSALKMLIYAN